MEQVDLQEAETRTVSVGRYINAMSQPFREKFLERKRSYQLNEAIVQRLRSYARDVVVVVFSAEWCKDCIANVPVLALITERIGMKVRVFGGLKKDPLNPKENWRIPPSPPEVKTFEVQKTPTLIIFNKYGKRLGTIVEKPKAENTLEEEILQIIQKGI
jgi:thiol-disulfide isomerase/thioredoxin